MTGKDLLERLQRMTESELNNQVIFANFVNGELSPVSYREVESAHFNPDSWKSEFGGAVIALEAHIDF